MSLGLSHKILKVGLTGETRPQAIEKDSFSLLSLRSAQVGEERFLAASLWRSEENCFLPRACGCQCPMVVGEEKRGYVREHPELADGGEEHVLNGVRL